MEEFSKTVVVAFNGVGVVVESSDALVEAVSKVVVVEFSNDGVVVLSDADVVVSCRTEVLNTRLGVVAVDVKFNNNEAVEAVETVGNVEVELS